MQDAFPSEDLQEKELSSMAESSRRLDCNEAPPVSQFRGTRLALPGREDIEKCQRRD